MNQLLFSPSPIPLPQGERGRAREIEMENDIGIDSCHHIIQDDSKSSFQSFSRWRIGRVENVEKAKEK